MANRLADDLIRGTDSGNDVAGWSSGASPNIPDGDGWMRSIRRPRAVMRGCSGRAGMPVADLRRREKEGRTPIRYRRKAEREKLVTMMLEKEQ